MVCIVDKKETNVIYENCVLDYHKPQDCAQSRGKKSRNECKFWLEKEKTENNRTKRNEK